MNNLFIVGTPGHYFNLLECIEEFDLKTNDSDLIFLNSNYWSSNQMTEDFINNYIDSTQWKSVNRITLWDSMTQKIYSIDNIQKIFSIIFQILTKYSFKKYDYLVLSQIEQFYSKLFYFFVFPKKVISLDEGNAIFRVLKLINSKRLRWPLPKKIIFFSSYNIQVQKYDTVVKCNYEYSKKILKKSIIKSDDVWFIGSPYLENELMDKDLYFESIKKIRSAYKFKNIKYFPHRREKKDNLNILAKYYQFSIMKIDCPIEMFFLQNRKLPNIISGFFSAALFNLQKMTEENIEIHSYFVQRHDSLTSMKEFIEIKNQYKEAGIRVINL
jgi:hypothetical protein